MKMRRGNRPHRKNVCLLLVLRNQRLDNSLNRLVTTHVFLKVTISITAHVRELRSFLIIVAIEFNRPLRWARHDQSTAECSRGNARPPGHPRTPMPNCAPTNKGDNHSDPCDEYRIPVKRMSSVGVIKPGYRKICDCN